MKKEVIILLSILLSQFIYGQESIPFSIIPNTKCARIGGDVCIIKRGEGASWYTTRGFVWSDVKYDLLFEVKVTDDKHLLIASGTETAIEAVRSLLSVTTFNGAETTSVVVQDGDIISFNNDGLKCSGIIEVLSPNEGQFKIQVRAGNIPVTNSCLVIPEFVEFENEMYKVTEICGSAFSGCTSLTSVTIPSSVTEIGHKTFFGCASLTSITIPSSVTKIGQEVFSGCTSLTSVTILSDVYVNTIEAGATAFGNCSSVKNVVIGENVTSIDKRLFRDCSPSRVTCYAANPPEMDMSLFGNYNGYLTIPCDNFEAYDIHPIWGNFKHIECVSAESTELPKDEVVVEPKISEAVFSMPTNASANSYTLTIQSNGVTFCTLTFNNQGQLANIDFSGSQLKAAVEGYQFTVTGLSASTGYNYSFKALDKSKSVLKEYTGSFTTKNADGTGGSTTTAIDDVELANAISIINNQIFVNGEAPAFVITSLGQKIANQNLKAGVYFVQVGNEMQGVAVK